MPHIEFPIILIIPPRNNLNNPNLICWCLQPTVESIPHCPLYCYWRVTSPRSPTAHRHCWQLPFQVLAFAMIASESDKRLGWFRFVWQHGHVPLDHKYEPRRTKLEKFFSKAQKYFMCQPSCEAEWEDVLVACKAHNVCFKMIGKCLKFQRQIQIFLFNRAQRRDKTWSKKFIRPTYRNCFCQAQWDFALFLGKHTMWFEIECARNLKFSENQASFLKRQTDLPFVLWWHNENVFRDHGWRRSGGVFVVGFLHIFLQVFIVNISKLLKF